MKNSYKLIVIVLIIVLFGVAVYSKAKMNKVTKQEDVVKVAWGQFPSALVIAEEKGYFKEEGIAIQKETIPNLNLTIEAIGRGDIDIASINYSTLFAYQNISPDKFKIFYGSLETKESPYTLLIAKKEIKKPIDLKGKKMAIRTGVHSEVEAKAVLGGIGLSEGSVELVVGETNFLITALGDSSISAVMAPETFATTILQKGLGEVLVKAPRAEYIFDPYPTAAGVISTETIKRSPDLSKRIKIAIDKAIDFMNTNEAETRDIFQNSLGLDAGVAKNMYLGENAKLEDIDRSLVEKLINFQLTNKLLEKRPDFSNVYYQE